VEQQCSVGIPVPDPDNIEHKKFVQNLALSTSEAVLFPRRQKVGLSFLIFLNFFITFHIGTGSKYEYGTC
jgi:hypothetical protein